MSFFATNEREGEGEREREREKSEHQNYILRSWKFKLQIYGRHRFKRRMRSEKKYHKLPRLPFNRLLLLLLWCLGNRWCFSPCTCGPHLKISATSLRKVLRKSVECKQRKTTVSLKLLSALCATYDGRIYNGNVVSPNQVVGIFPGKKVDKLTICLLCVCLAGRIK